MADIALLVAEEFERRRRWLNEDGLEELHRGAYSCAVAVGKKLERGASAFKEMEVVRRAVRPETPVGLAAFDGLFSA